MKVWREDNVFFKSNLIKERGFTNRTKKHRLPEGINDAMERISKNLILNLPESEGKAYLMCSALRYEGCSTIACSLARILALSLNKSVVIVDANLRSPSVHEFFDLPREDGLADVLSGEVEPWASIKKTGVENLFVVTSGNPSTSGESIFETKKILDYLSYLRTKHQFLIIDSASILMYSDSLGLARYMDGVILVVESERIRREVALKAKESLQTVGARIVGVVINKRRHYIPESIYRRLI